MFECSERISVCNQQFELKKNENKKAKYPGQYSYKHNFKSRLVTIDNIFESSK
jgi:hypothetical protein